jgi:hypothetical protein
LGRPGGGAAILVAWAFLRALGGSFEGGGCALELRPIPGMLRWRSSYSGIGWISELGSIRAFSPKNPNI